MDGLLSKLDDVMENRNEEVYEKLAAIDKKMTLVMNTLREKNLL